MIPRTFPSTFAANGQQQMVVYSLPSITGLTAWIDYIPVKGVTTESATLENTYANGGYQVVNSLASLTGKQAWLDYIPVYEDASYTKPWSTDAGGYIPTSALAALLLDFTSGRLDPRITFSRTTNATVTNSAGLIANAPMNLLTFSEQFDNAAWTKTNTTVTANSAVAPDSATTGDAVIESLDVAVTNHQIGLTTPFAFVSGVAYTNSVFAKPANGVRSLRLAFPSAAFGSAPLAYFDLQNGTVLSGTGASITSVGNGWFRCSYTQTATATASSSFLTVGVSQGTTRDYVGNGTSGIFIWGAQLEASSTATAYSPTTVKNLLGFTEHFDNAAWTKSSAFVQTNLVTFSEMFADATWGKNETTITANTTAAPDGSVTADTFTETTTTGAHAATQALTVSAVSHTFSVYLKKGDGATAPDWMQLSFGGTSTAYANFNLATGTVGTFSGGTSSITFTGNGWYRCSVTVTPTAGSMTVQIVFTNNADSGRRPSYAGQTTSNVFIWGAQLVQGTTPGDYKATFATAAAVGYTDIYGQPFAQKLVENTANANHQLSVAATLGAAINTFSIYLKAAERTWVRIIAVDGGAFVNLTTGTLGTVAAGTVSFSASTPVDLGNGWFRVSGSFSAAAGSNTVVVRVATEDGTTSYTGDGTSGIYIFGAQLSDSASVDPYVYQPVSAPTSTAYYGPRFDYDPVTRAPKGLLIEEQRTNLLLNSSVLGTQVVTVAAAAHTLSFYGTGTVVLSGAFVGTVVGTGAYPTRTTLTFTPIVGALTVTVTGSVTLAQLELGSFATSYIPTVASQVTRAADMAVMRGNNFLRWYNQTTGTFAATYEASPNAFTSYFVASNGVTAQNSVHFDNDSGNMRVVYYSGSSAVATLGLGARGTVGTVNKVASAYAVNDFAASRNAGAVVTDTSGAVPVALTQLNIGADPSGAATNVMNTCISRITYYNRRLANTELTAITS